MSTNPLIDQYNRQIGSVRISLTDRCNLRCQYCMPEDGIEWVNREEILSFEEIIRIMEIFHRHQVRKFRLTGGEPTIRSDIISFISKVKKQMPDIDLSMTTNGLSLDRLAYDLKAAGLDRVNISLDTLHEEKYNKITRRKKFKHVIAGIKSALKADFDQVKINAVSIKSFNSDLESLTDFIDFSEEYGVEVRFIELMPFTGNEWEDGGFISSAKLREIIRKKEDLIELPMDNPSSTSKTWSARDGKAKLGFISSVTESFCDNCNRVRITAEGNLRPCLHNKKEYPLKPLIRSGASDSEILNLIKKGLNEKWKEHPDFLSLKYLPPLDDREMIRIGG